VGNQRNSYKGTHASLELGADLRQKQRAEALMNVLINFIKGIFFYRSIIMTMAIREIQTRYAGTLAGFVWSIVNPLMMILVFWFVFSVGFKVRPVGDVPYGVYFWSITLVSFIIGGVVFRKLKPEFADVL